MNNIFLPTSGKNPTPQQCFAERVILFSTIATCIITLLEKKLKFVAQKRTTQTLFAWVWIKIFLVFLISLAAVPIAELFLRLYVRLLSLVR